MTERDYNTLRGLKKVFIKKYNIEIPEDERVIPLWLFGFLN
jgi:hypothetical protein